MNTQTQSFRRALVALVSVMTLAACGGPLEDSAAAPQRDAPVSSAENPLTIILPLENLVPVNDLSGSAGSERYYKFTVPNLMQDLRFELSGGTGNANLFVKYGAMPDVNGQDEQTCASIHVGNTDQCTYPTSMGGTWYVTINGAAAYSGVTLKASYTLPLNTTLSGLLDATGGEQYFKVDGGAFTALMIQIAATSGSTGDADLYVRFGDLPTTSAYDCRPFTGTSSESCNFSSAFNNRGPAYIMIRGYSSYSNVNLVANAY